MLIESIIKRPKGTHTKMPDGTVYSFLPNKHGDHVAEVADIDHVQRLLAITEGYRPYGDGGAKELAALEAAGNELSEIESAMKPELSGDLAKMTMEELQAEYHHVFGRAAPPLIKYETLLRKLSAARLEAKQQE